MNGSIEFGGPRIIGPNGGSPGAPGLSQLMEGEYSGFPYLEIRQNPLTGRCAVPWIAVPWIAVPRTDGLCGVKMTFSMRIVETEQRRHRRQNADRRASRARLDEL
jgi:hypothetical protein